MKLNPYKEIGEKGWGLIRIYADNKLVATSPEIRQKNKDTVEFEVDIKSVEYLKIEPVVTPAFSTEYDGEIIIRDVKTLAVNNLGKVHIKSNPAVWAFGVTGSYHLKNLGIETSSTLFTKFKFFTT